MNTPNTCLSCVNPVFQEGTQKEFIQGSRPTKWNFSDDNGIFLAASLCVCEGGREKGGLQFVSLCVCVFLCVCPQGAVQPRRLQPWHPQGR